QWNTDMLPPPRVGPELTNIGSTRPRWDPKSSIEPSSETSRGRSRPSMIGAVPVPKARRSVGAVGGRRRDGRSLAALAGREVIQDGFRGGRAEAGGAGLVQGEQGVEAADPAGRFDLDVRGDCGAHQL